MPRSIHVLAARVTLLASAALIAAMPSAAEPVDPSLTAAIERTLYRIEATPDGRYRAANPAQGLHAVITPEGFEAVASGEAAWRFGLGLVRLGRGDTTFELLAAGSEPQLDGTELSFPRGPVTEWYRNGPRGLEHGFTLEERPAGPDEPLALELNVTGELPFELSRDRDGLVFRTKGSQLLRYGRLHAFDAEGNDLPAAFEIAANDRVRIVVQDQGAVYPVTIDPLVVVGEFKLVGLATAPGAGLGNSVAVAGPLALVGSSQGLHGGVSQGVAYVFRRTDGVWAEEQRIRAVDSEAGDAFGSSVAIYEERLIIGAEGDDDPVAGVDAGSAYFYEWQGSYWTLAQKITASDVAAGDRFGSAVSHFRNDLVVGAMGADVGGNADQGALYAYRFDGVSFGTEDKLTVSDGAAGDALGIALSVTVRFLVAGSGASDGSSLPGSAYVFSETGGVWSEDQKLTASDGAAGDLFGRSVSISGDITSSYADDAESPLLVGAPGDDDHGTDSGAAYAYRFDGSSWTGEQKLLASDASAGDQYGRSVAISETRAAVGASGTSNGGQAYVYRDDLGTWVEDGILVASDGAAGDRLGVAVSLYGSDVLAGADLAGGTGGAAYLFRAHEEGKLLPSDGAAGDQFGRSVSVSGHRALVGARHNDVPGTGEGSAYIFRFDGSAWAEEQKLLASNAPIADLFGASVSLSGDVAVVGAFGGSQPGLGAAYVFRFDGSTWVEEQELWPSDFRFNRFGQYVSVAGDVLLVGAYSDDDNGTDAGAAYVYRFDGSSWVEEQKLLASDGAEEDKFGSSVSISGDRAAVGAALHDQDGENSGAAYVYHFDGSAWVEEQKLLASSGDVGDLFGESVSISGDVVLVGGSSDDDAGTNAGSAYVYRFDGSTWVEEQQLLASNGDDHHWFGSSVSVSGDMALVSAYRYEDTIGIGSDSGSAYLYRFDGSTWAEEQQLLASDRAAKDYFGYSVSVSSDWALAGAYQDDDNGESSGAAYAFYVGSCGDGTLDPGEACDDGNREIGDGCDALCQFEACNDLVDNDGDGLTDFAGGDPGCSSPADQTETDPALPCDDGIDNDGDGLADFPNDPGCGSLTDGDEIDPALPCDNGLDDDSDGFADVPDDPGCASPSDQTETDPALPCDDGIDNDGDGLTDLLEDPGCTYPFDPTETDAALPCDDGIDNDGDGRTDHDPVTSASPGDTLNDPAGTGDPVCRDPWFAREDALCQDGIDNDSTFGTDYDGGRSILGAGGIDPDGPDPTCGQPWFNREAPKGCGLGFELTPLLLGLLTLRRRRSMQRAGD